MKKILDFLLIFLLVYLTISLFTWWTQEKELDGKVVFWTSDSSYTIPASVKLEIENNSAEEITINSCDNISLTAFWDEVDLSSRPCEDKIIPSGAKDVIDYTDQYGLFKETGDYVFEIQYGEKRHIAQFEIEHKGTISKLFIALFYQPIYNIMIFFMKMFSGSLGYAIIGMTILIRIILLWPQHKMMLAQKKLQGIQPKIKEIQEKYKGKQQELGMKLMELYKKEKVNPMGSCGFLLIQMPILLVIYNIILNVTDHSNYFYIYTALSNYDLTSTSYTFYGIDLLAAGWTTWIALALTVALIQFIQVKLSLAKNKQTKKDWVVLEKKKDAKDYNSMMPDPEMMNKFMLYGMPAMVAVFTYTLIAWVWIYWWMSTLFMIFQQLVVNKIMKK